MLNLSQLLDRQQFLGRNQRQELQLRGSRAFPQRVKRRICRGNVQRLAPRSSIGPCGKL